MFKPEEAHMEPLFVESWDAHTQKGTNRFHLYVHVTLAKRMQIHTYPQHTHTQTHQQNYHVYNEAHAYVCETVRPQLLHIQQRAQASIPSKRLSVVV